MDHHNQLCIDIDKGAKIILKIGGEFFGKYEALVVAGSCINIGPGGAKNKTSLKLGVRGDSNDGLVQNARLKLITGPEREAVSWRNEAHADQCQTSVLEKGGACSECINKTRNGWKNEASQGGFKIKAENWKTDY